MGTSRGSVHGVIIVTLKLVLGLIPLVSVTLSFVSTSIFLVGVADEI